MPSLPTPFPPAILPPAIFLMGPTASGKTAVATELLQHLPLEIISVDSALIYRDMNIGTAKPDTATLQRAPHHLLNIISPVERYSAAAFRHDALQLMHDITQRRKIPLLVGGTMLYFHALQFGLSALPIANATVRAELNAQAAQIGWPAMHENLAKIDPVTAARLKPNDSQRIQRALEIFKLTDTPMSTLIAQQETYQLPYRIIPIALLPSDRAVLHAHIATSFSSMLQQGLLDEMRQLQTRYILHSDLPAMRCVGYRQAWQFLAGELSEHELVEHGLAATRQLAKRQLTWLRGMADNIEFDCLAQNLAQQVLERVKQEIAAQ